MLAQGLMALGVVGWLGTFVTWWAALPAAALMAAVLIDVARQRLRGALRLQPREGAAPLLAWRPAGSEVWQQVPLRCDYLGPWLIGLRLPGRRLWLWPDSGNAESLRRLRKALLSLP
ncbi:MULTISPECIES: hypothetical protein [Halomonas]|uniref:Toxin CptA n=1 Tax=Halomonas halophila TaxID=29573 RepID=A0ABQ0U772_9GAMM|nr:MULTISPECIES: hypothetical protein [Halomonas]MDR5890633.1 hypothetical protein [Halomonas salina]RAH38075.1 hypothetical protein C9J49_006490 [Halomonas sp. SL1]WJY06005.1 hypothetical protein QWG60_09800 [Halomonas halophila]GEK74328.1 hypothetical protein HHA04nite_28720 [Halomonas halophila]